VSAELKVDWTPFDPATDSPWVWAIIEEEEGPGVVRSDGGLENFDPARVPFYAVELIDQPVDGIYYGRYRADFPWEGTPAGYYYVVYRQAAVPGLPDLLADTILGSERDVRWGGVPPPPPIGPAGLGLCNVAIYFTLSRVPVAGAVARANLVNINSTAPAEQLSNQVLTATTNATGTCMLTLVQKSYFLRGDGVYHITVTAPDRTVAHDFRCTIPDVNSISLTDLIPPKVP